MWAMSGRPCNPDSDFKRLWQILLPNTPPPQCSVPREPESAAETTVEAEQSDRIEIRLLRLWRRPPPACG
jgi:hypothetical protein